MKRTRNLNEFRQQIRTIKDQYNQTFGPIIAKLRAKYTGRLEESELNVLLEFHKREYFINAFLAALNWRQDKDPEDGLPNLAPEVPVHSQQKKTIRFFDYLGFEKDTMDPLLIVETKRPSAELPKPKNFSAGWFPEVVAKGLTGKLLTGDWNKWLNDLKDYVLSAKTKSEKVPKRVVITNGNWLILFLDPEDAFLNDDPDSNYILVFENWNYIETRASEIFEHLEYRRVIGEIKSLDPQHLCFYVNAEDIEGAMYGLHLRYIVKPRIHQKPLPEIVVSPMLFLQTKSGGWLRVECPSEGFEFELPHNLDNLPQHLDDVKNAAQKLLLQVNKAMNSSIEIFSLEEYYTDGELIENFPLVQDISPDDFLVVTGNKIHYLLPTSSSNFNCPYHNWENTDRSEPGIFKRSTDPRAFFVSGEPYPCARKDVKLIKAKPLSLKYQAFCKIWSFEQHLCCKLCVFSGICWKDDLLPCVNEK